MDEGDDEIALQKLQEIETLLVNLLQQVSNVCEGVSAIPGNTKSLEQESKSIIGDCHTIRSGLLSQLGLLSDNNPYKCSLSSYGVKKDMEIVHMKTVLVHDLLLTLKPKQQSGPVEQIIPEPDEGEGTMMIE
eukprot:TRINITY_DN6092_c0_g1_i1.p1 TRINITY_DN6092_c0_g1~~TRINITY_DN6092_c0_g1_i1.p1  ORF type:complete len:143 (-),score=38.67 TRINITY_DN6092_c0_g1_i1:69-464(-)